MAQNTLEIIIKASSGKAVAELKTLDKTLSKFGSTGGKSMDTLKAKWAGLNKTLSSPEGMKMIVGTAGAVVGALAGVGMAIKGLADDYMGYAFQVEDFARVIGSTPEEASKLIQVADDVRLSTESMTAALKFAIKNGIDPTVESLGALSDEYLSIQSGAERTRFLLEKFGRAGLEMGKLLELGSDKIEEMGDSIEGTARLMTTEGIQAAKDYYTALDDVGDAVMDLKLELGAELLPTVSDSITSFAEFARSGVDLINMFQALQMGMEAEQITLGGAIKLVAEYMGFKIEASDITGMFVTKLWTETNALIEERRALEYTTTATNEYSDETGEAAGNIQKAATALNNFAGAARKVPSKIGIDFEFSLPDITSELERGFEDVKWKEAGGTALDDFYSGVKDNLKNLSGEEFTIVAPKIAALEQAVKIEIGEITPQQAKEALQKAFPGMKAGEAGATIEAALAINPNSEVEIRAYLEQVLTQPTSFVVTPTADPVSLEELKTLMAGPYEATVNVGASDTSRATLIEQIKGYVKDEEIPVTMVAHLKEMNKVELAALAQSLAPEPVEISIAPKVDETILDKIYADQLEKPAEPPMIPKVDFTALNNAVKLLQRPVYVPMIPVLAGTDWKMPAAKDQKPGRYRHSGGPVASNQSYLVGERGPELFVPNTSGQIVANPAGTTVNNYFTIAGQQGWNIRELARLVTREQQRAGVK